MYEIPTIGGGEEMVAVFNAVASWTSAGGYKSLLQVTLVLAFGYALFNLAFNMNVKAFFKWFLQITAVYLILLVPTASVRIDDKTAINPLSGPQVVDNVPLGLAAIASFSSEAGFYLTRTAETVFSISPERKYHENGYVFGALLFRKANNYSTPNPLYRFNTVNFMENCVLRSLALGYNTPETFLNSENIMVDLATFRWGALGTEMRRFSSDPGTFMPCDDAFATLSSSTAFNSDDIRDFANTIYGGNVTGNAATDRFISDLSTHATTFYGGTGGIDTKALPYMRQVSMVNMFNEAWAGYGGATPDSFSVLRSDIQARNTYASSANQAMTWVPLLQLVLTIVFYALFPLVFPLLFFPSTGPTVLKGYFTGFFYLAAWGPIYAVLNMFILGRADSAYQSLPGDSLTIANYGQVLTIGDDLASMAGYLLILVPFLAVGIAKGASVVAGQAGAMLRPAQGAAEISATETTTGDYSYGNVSYANTSAHNTQANKFDDAPSRTYGAATETRVMADGTLMRTAQDGSISQDASPMMGRLPEMVSSTAATRAVAGQRQEEARSFLNTLSAAHTRLSREEAANSQSVSRGSTRTDGTENSVTQASSTGTENRTGEQTSRTTHNSQSDGYQSASDATTGTSQSSSVEGIEDFNRGVRAELGIGGKAGIGAGGNRAGVDGGIRGHIGKNWSDREIERADSNTSQSQSERAYENSERGLNRSRSETDSASDFSGQRNEEAARQFNSLANTYSQQRVESFSQLDAESREIALRTAAEESERWSRYNDIVQSDDFSVTGDITQPVASLYEQYRAENPNEFLPSATATNVSAEEFQLRRQRMEAIARDFVGDAVNRDISNDATAFDNELSLGSGQPNLGDLRPAPLSGSIERPSTIGNEASTTPLLAAREGRFDARSLAQDLGLGLKSSNVNISNLDGRLAPALQAVAQSAEDLGLGHRVITSGADSPSAHVPGSKHGSGNALDFRGRDISIEQGNAWAAQVRERLGDGYFVDFETFDNSNNNHLHVQTRN